MHPLSMDRDDFIEGLREQYSNQIQQAYLACEHDKNRVDWKQLNEKLNKLMKSAVAEGLSRPQFEDLIRHSLPEVFGQVHLKSKRAA
jgi:hypothetical protein